jgi:hypothetical protein
MQHVLRFLMILAVAKPGVSKWGGVKGEVTGAGGPGAVPPEKFSNYRCTQVSFSAFFRQKSAHSRLYLCL